tara:strand:- start:12777 stop:14207 length:1431 start_codon:yes stop_codon:yes gene_type:complete
MAVKESLKFNWFEIKSNINPQERIDLRAGTARIEYRESVFSPYIEVTGYVADTGNTVPDKDEDGEAVGLLDGEFCTGTEEIVFEIEDMKGNKVSLANEDGLDLRLASVTSAKQSFQNQTFIITAVGKEAFDNTLLDNRCRRQYSGKISTLVNTIFKGDLKSANSIDIDETLNQYHEWGNERYPFEMLLDLQRLAIPNLQTSDGQNSLGNTAGYLFWQTSTGFHFKSLDKLFDMTDKEIKTYIENKKASGDEELPIMAPLNGEGGPAPADGKILFSFNQRSINALEDFESSNRGTALEVYNPNLAPEEQFKHSELSVELDEDGKSKGNGITAGKTLPVFNKEYKDKRNNKQVICGIERTRAAFSPVKGQQTIESQVQETGELNYDVQTTFQQSHQNFRQKMNMFTEIVIEADLSLHAGDLIYCEFEEMTTKKTVRGSRLRDSGIYMIADLCHYGDGTKAFTGLNLVRDAFGVKSPPS